MYDDGVCSGGAECKDGSDETAEVCSTHFCPEPAFRCDYGACVPRTARCDGKRDCVDGSDEKVEMCANATNGQPSRGQTQRPSVGSSFAVASANLPSSCGSVLNQFRELLFNQESQIAQLRQENLQLRVNFLESVGLEVSRTPARPAQPNRTMPVKPALPTLTNPSRPLTTEEDYKDPVGTRRPVTREPLTETRRPEITTPPPPISLEPREEGIILKNIF